MARAFVLAIAALALAIGLRTTDAAPSDWVGTKVCSGCHQAAYDSWKRGPHASATDALGADRKRQRCLGCHATGEAPAGLALFDGVGCESCHGAGAGYVPEDIMRDPPLRTALGLVPLSTDRERVSVCRRCHQQELRLEAFSVGTGWSRLPHSQSSRSATGASPSP